MKKTLLFVALLGLCVANVHGAASGQVIISEIVDGNRSGGLPKFVELSNVGDAPFDLGALWIGNFSNGGTTLGGGAATQLSGVLAAGDSYVVSYENGDSPGVGTFYDTYGFDPDNFDQGSYFNGDDVLAIFDGPATGDGTDANIVDLFGVVGVDGTGEPWEYTNGYAYRNADVGSPNATFTLSEWTFGGPNSLAGADDAENLSLLIEKTSPGVHPAVVPEPSTLALGGFGLLAVLLFRRRA